MIGLSDLALVMVILSAVLWLRGWATESLGFSTAAAALMLLHRERERQRAMAAGDDDDGE